MRRAAVVVALLAAVGGLVWWLAGPKPGESMFAGWKPGASGKIWSIAGSADSGRYVFVDPSGAYQPRCDSYSVRFYLYDCDRRRILRPASRGLCDTPDVTPFFVWPGIAELVVAVGDRDCRAFIHMRNTSRIQRRLSLFVVAVPYQVTGALGGSENVTYDASSRVLLIGGKVLFSCDEQPDAHAAYDASTDDAPSDITGFIRRGVLPRSHSAYGGPRKITSAAVRFDVALRPSGTWQTKIASPTTSVGLERWINMYAQTPVMLSGGLGKVGLNVPDKRCERCFAACIGYLALLRRDGNPVPGPTRYRAFWIRDCAYMTDALYYSGQQDLIPRALATIRAMQLPNGGFPPKLGAKTDDELDAPGEAIYALVQHYRRTRDAKWLRRQWPCIYAACRYIRDMRLHGPPECFGSKSLLKPPGSGILPASVSAEDLGEDLRQHYWDDFWCVRGLRDAAYAARALGRADDARWISAEADSLMDATVSSIRETTAKHSIGYIPNGPDEVTSSAMARGTSCALWPCGVLDPADHLTRASFDTYWRKWIEPYGGGFVHKGHYWPYAGLDLAQGYLMLGERERAWRILDWTLSHDPTDGFYAWPEGMSRHGLGLAEGDMPHGWMCAAYISLLRNVLVRESGPDLLLLSGVPKHWLRPGSVIEIEGFPTEFGRVSYRAQAFGGVLKLTISGARPNGSYRVCLPGREIVLPTYTRTAHIRLR